jgi:hypothetical protein
MLIVIILTFFVFILFVCLKRDAMTSAVPNFPSFCFSAYLVYQDHLLVFAVNLSLCFTCVCVSYCALFYLCMCFLLCFVLLMYVFLTVFCFYSCMCFLLCFVLHVYVFLTVLCFTRVCVSYCALLYVFLTVFCFTRVCVSYCALFYSCVYFILCFVLLVYVFLTVLCFTLLVYGIFHSIDVLSLLLHKKSLKIKVPKQTRVIFKRWGLLPSLTMFISIGLSLVFTQTR